MLVYIWQLLPNIGLNAFLLFETVGRFDTIWEPYVCVVNCIVSLTNPTATFQTVEALLLIDLHILGEPLRWFQGHRIVSVCYLRQGRNARRSAIYIAL